MPVSKRARGKKMSAEESLIEKDGQTDTAVNARQLPLHFQIRDTSALTHSPITANCRVGSNL